ncbi:MAG: winged helix-turn-helix domain-containing protein [Tepidisphaeraceae bacterium]
MHVLLHDSTDLDRLGQLAAAERQAFQRDRYRSVLFAVDGLEGDGVAERLGRSPRFVDEWVGRYRRSGIAALTPKKQPGKPPKLTAEQEAKLKARLDVEPTPADGVCTVRGKDIVRILEREFGVKHTLGSIYGVLARIGYSCLTPRPRHEKADPQLVRQFKEQSPFLSGS